MVEIGKIFFKITNDIVQKKGLTTVQKPILR